VDKRLVHKDDPATSQDALRRVERSGKRLGHGSIVYMAVTAHPGRTSCELIPLTLLKQYQVRRRLTDLKNQGLIERKLPRQCHGCGSMESTWWEAPQVAVQNKLL
jgi:hypothetical protein